MKNAPSSSAANAAAAVIGSLFLMAAATVNAGSSSWTRATSATSQVDNIETGGAYASRRGGGAEGYWQISQAFQSQVKGTEDPKSPRPSGYGASVKISADAGTLAVGSPLEDQVYVYREQTEDDTSTWLVHHVEGETQGEHFGQHVALSKSGNALAVGSYAYTNHLGDAVALEGAGRVSLFDFQENDYVNLFSGEDMEEIRGEMQNERLGWCVAVSEGHGERELRVSAGNLAGGATGVLGDDGKPSVVGGQVKAFSVESTSAATAKLESTLQEEDPGELFGFSIDQSADGSIIAVGASQFQDDTGVPVGRVQVFLQDGEKMSGSLLGAQGHVEHFGTQVAVSASGQTVAVIGYLLADDGSDAATVIARVYDYTSSSATWQPRGHDISIPNSKVEAYGGGIAMSLAGDGKTLALRRATLQGEGVVYVFHWDSRSATWRLQQELTQQTLLASGIVTNEIHFGWSLSLNHDGTILGVGSIAMYEDDQGYAFLFELEDGSFGEAYAAGLSAKKQVERELQATAEPSDQPSDVPVSDVGGEPSAVPTVITDKPSPAPTGPPSTGPVTPPPTSEPTNTCAQPGGFCIVDLNCCVDGSTCLKGAPTDIFGVCLSPATFPPTSGPTDPCQPAGTLCTTEADCCVDGSTCFFVIPDHPQGVCLSPATGTPTGAPTRLCSAPNTGCFVDANCCVAGSTCFGGDVASGTLGLCISPATQAPTFPPPTGSPTRLCAAPGTVCFVPANCCVVGSTCFGGDLASGAIGLCISPPTLNPTFFPTGAPTPLCSQPGTGCFAAGNCCAAGSTCPGGDPVAGVLGICVSPPTGAPTPLCSQPGTGCFAAGNCCITGSTCPGGDPVAGVLGVCVSPATEAPTPTVTLPPSPSVVVTSPPSPGVVNTPPPSAPPTFPPTLAPDVTAEPTTARPTSGKPTVRPTFVPTTASPTRNNCLSLDSNCTMSMSCCTNLCSGMMGMDQMCIRCAGNNFDCAAPSDCCQPAFGSGLLPMICNAGACSECLAQGTACTADNECCPGNSCRGMNMMMCASTTSSPTTPPGSCIANAMSCDGSVACCTSSFGCYGTMPANKICKMCANPKENCSVDGNCCVMGDVCQMNACCGGTGKMCNMNTDCCTKNCVMSNMPMCGAMRRRKKMRKGT